MPAGTDLVTWSPRVGATGDDRYDLPENSATKAGASDYSDPPTLDEINARSGMNQIIAEINRRIAIIDDPDRFGGGPGLTPANYVSAGDRVLRSKIIELQTLVNAIRSAEGNSSYSFTTVTIGLRIAELHLFELREALAIDHFKVYVFATADHSDNISRRATSYPPEGKPGEVILVGSSLLFAQTKQSTLWIKFRAYVAFKIPSWMPDFSAADIYVRGKRNNSALGSENVLFYRSNTYLGKIDTGDWGHLDVLLGSITRDNLFTGTVTQNKLVSLNDADYYAGTSYHFIVTVQGDINNDNTGVTSGNDVMQLIETTTHLRLYV